MKELNNRALVISSALDLTEDGKVILTDQFANPNALGRTIESPSERFYTMSATGDTILQASQLIQTRLPRYIFLAHRRNIFIGQATAEKGLQNTMDVYTRSPDSRMRTDISVVKDNHGSEVLEIPSLIEKLPSIAALKSRSVVGGGQPGSTFVNFLMAANSKTTCPTLPLIEIKSFQDDYASGIGDRQIVFAGRAVFDKTLHMVGEISYRETVYRFWEAGRLTHQTFAVNIPSSDKHLSIYTNHMKSKIVPQFQNNHLTVALYLKADGRITENNTNLDFMKQKSIQEAQTAINNMVNHDMTALITRIQREYHTDIFGFDRATQIRYPLLWPRLTHNWAQLFTNATVTVHTNIKIKTVGESGAPLHHQVSI